MNEVKESTLRVDNGKTDVMRRGLTGRSSYRSMHQICEKLLIAVSLPRGSFFVVEVFTILMVRKDCINEDEKDTELRMGNISG